MSVSKKHSKINYKFKDLNDIIDSRLLNGYVELKGISLTHKQLDELDRIIKSDPILRRVVRGLNTYEFTIVSNIDDSNIDDSNVKNKKMFS